MANKTLVPIEDWSTNTSANNLVPKVKWAATVTAATSFTLPANAFIERILIVNTTAKAVTGGVKFGTTNGGTDVAAAIAVGANAIVSVADTAILKRWFSAASTQSIFIGAVTAFNSASLNITVIYGLLS